MDRQMDRWKEGRKEGNKEGNKEESSSLEVKSSEAIPALVPIHIFLLLIRCHGTALCKLPSPIFPVTMD